MTGDTPFAEIDNMRGLDELFLTADLNVYDSELVTNLTDLVIVEALQNYVGHKLLYDRQYRQFVTVTCDWG